MAYWRLNVTCKKCDKFKANQCKGMNLCPVETHDRPDCWTENGLTRVMLFDKCLAEILHN
jgi:hypothetical protein